MTSKRVSAPFDLASEFESDDDPPKKASTLTRQSTIVTPQAPAKPAISKQKTLVSPPKPTKSAPKPAKSASKQVSAAQTPASAPQKRVPPRKPFTNGLFKPLTDRQVDMEAAAPTQRATRILSRWQAARSTIRCEA